MKSSASEPGLMLLLPNNSSLKPFFTFKQNFTKLYRKFHDASSKDERGWDFVGQHLQSTQSFWWMLLFLLHFRRQGTHASRCLLNLAERLESGRWSTLLRKTVSSQFRLNSVVSDEWRKCVYSQFCTGPKGPKWREKGRLRNKKWCK